MVLDKRKMLVLQAIIEDYVSTAEPVGSRTIARRYKLGVSPATIRNEMSDLEETGFLQQPHISAGRIPSDKGYRYYVDVLMEPLAISADKRREIQSKVQARRREVEQLIQETSRILSFLTNYTAVVLAPQVDSLVLQHIQLVPLDASTVLVVMVLYPGMVQNRIFTTKHKYTTDELAHISGILNNKLKGVSYREIGSSLIREIKEELGEIANVLLELVTQELSQGGTEYLYLDGTVHIFNQPEFKDLERARSLLNVFEQKETLSKVINELAQCSGVRVSIGNENEVQDIKHCSIVASTYSINGEVMGTIGVLGPTRMEYAKVFSLVELMADSLSEILSELIK